MLKFVLFLFLTSSFLSLTACSFLGGKSVKNLENQSTQFANQKFSDDENIDEEARILIADEEAFESERTAEVSGLDSEDLENTNKDEDSDISSVVSVADPQNKIAKEDDIKSDDSNLEEPQTLDDQELDVVEADGGKPDPSGKEYTSEDLYGPKPTKSTEELADIDSKVKTEINEFVAPPKKWWVSVKKIRIQPFTKNGILANGVYLVRPGETLKSISQKLYDKNRISELKKINPHFSRKKVKIGDKVYYNSTLRPKDNQRLLTYYEERNLSPSTYVVKGEENIRVISKKLLGNSQSWKEVWATNPSIESKGVLSAGTALQYWPKDIESIAHSTIKEEEVAPLVEESQNKQVAQSETAQSETAQPETAQPEVAQAGTVQEKEKNSATTIAKTPPPATDQVATEKTDTALASQEKTETNLKNDDAQLVEKDLSEQLPEAPSEEETVAAINPTQDPNNLDASNSNANGSVGEENLPTSAVADNSPPPPILQTKNGPKPASIDIAGFSVKKDYLMMGVAGIGLLAIGGILLAIIKKRKRSQNINFGELEENSDLTEFSDERTEVTMTRIS